MLFSLNIFRWYALAGGPNQPWATTLPAHESCMVDNVDNITHSKQIVTLFMQCINIIIFAGKVLKISYEKLIYKY